MNESFITEKEKIKPKINNLPYINEIDLPPPMPPATCKKCQCFIIIDDNMFNNMSLKFILKKTELFNLINSSG